MPGATICCISGVLTCMDQHEVVDECVPVVFPVLRQGGVLGELAAGNLQSQLHAPRIAVVVILHAACIHAQLHMLSTETLAMVQIF